MRTLGVDRFKSGEREGQLRPFTLPDGATIVNVSLFLGSAVVYYVVPIGRVAKGGAS